VLARTAIFFSPLTIADLHCGHVGSFEKVKLSRIHPLQSSLEHIHTDVISIGTSSCDFFRELYKPHLSSHDMLIRRL